MSCTELTDLQRRVLEELAAEKEPSDLATVETFRSWGWVMPGSFELTGGGRNHTDQRRQPGVM